SPNFNAGRLPKIPEQLKAFRILCDESRREWNTWSRVTGIAIDHFKHETHHSDSNLMLTAAKAGQGIAMGRHSLVASEIAAGNLIRLFDIVAPSEFHYYLVTSTGQKKTAALLAFEKWLRQEAAAFSH
ncbi:MAG: XRE family transcriptional regulator, partial [Undibacterium sp.]|nr:XRE family transcriptional regulator [Undibacterium sp.]